MKTLTPEYIEHLKGERDRHLKIAEHLTAIIAMDGPELSIAEAAEITASGPRVEIVIDRKKKTKAPPQSSKKKSGTGESKYDEAEVRKLAQRVASKEISTEDAAAELGCSIATWYTLKSKFAKDIKKVKAAAAPKAEEPAAPRERKFHGDIDELRERVQELKAEGMTSTEVAKELGLNLQTVGKVW